MNEFGQLPMFYWVAMFFLTIIGFWFFAYVLQTLQFKRSNSCNPLPPGPPGLPIIGHLHMLGDLPHRTLHKLSQKYGSIMQLRLGLVPTVVVSSPEMVELFMKKHDLVFLSRPKIQASEYLSYGSRGAIYSQYGAYWRNVRKLYSVHLLSMSKIDSFRPLRMEEVMSFVKVLKGAAEGHEVVNISAQVGSVIQKILYRMIFGNRYKQRYNFEPCVQDALELIAVPNVADFVPFLKPFDLQGLKRRLKKVSKVMDEYMENIIDEHEQDNLGQLEPRSDFIDVMLSIMKSDDSDEEKLDRADIKAITLDMVQAGMASSVTTIEWALTELVRHPQVIKKLQEELVNIVGMDRVVEEADLGKLSYLDMVVKEVLRLHPPTPLNPRESIDDISIKGFHIPKKSLIIINALAVGLDPDAWSDNAEEFYPERFTNSNIGVGGLSFQLIPFGSGRRKCPAIELGITTVQLVLAQLLHCFNFELPNGISPRDVDIKEKNGVTVRKANPLFVVPTYRLHIKGPFGK